MSDRLQALRPTHYAPWNVWWRSLALGFAIATIFIAYPGVVQYMSSGVPERYDSTFEYLYGGALLFIMCVGTATYFQIQAVYTGKPNLARDIANRLGLPRWLWIALGADFLVSPLIALLFPWYEVTSGFVEIVFLIGLWLWLGTKPGSTPGRSMRDEWGDVPVGLGFRRNHAVLMLTLMVPFLILNEFDDRAMPAYVVVSCIVAWVIRKRNPAQPTVATDIQVSS